MASEPSSYGRALLGRWWALVLAAAGGIVAVLGGLSTVQEWAIELGMSAWWIVAGGAILLTAALHLAQYLTWRETTRKLAEVEQTGKALPLLDRNRLIELKSSAGQLTETATTLGILDILTYQNLCTKVQTLGGQLRHYPDVRQAFRDLLHHTGVIVGTRARDQGWSSSEERRETYVAAEEAFQHLVAACDSLLQS